MTLIKKWYIGIILLSFSCSSEINGQESREDLIQEAFSIISLNWRRDSLGCNGFRDFRSALVLRDYHNLIGNTQKNVIEIYGTPEKIYEGKFYYYFGNSCDCSGKFVGEDRCMMIITFVESVVVDISFPCT